MKKTFTLFFAFLQVFALSSCNESLSIIEEMNNEYDAFMEEFQKTSKFESYSLVNAIVYQTEDATTPILDSRVDLRMSVDSTKPYVYMKTTTDDSSPITDLYMPYSEEIIHYQNQNMEFDIIQNEEPSTEIKSLLEGNMTSDSSLVLLNTSTITKDDQGNYLFSTTINDLVGEDKETVIEFLTGIGVSEESQSSIILDFTYTFNSENHTMSYTLTIPRYLEQRTQMYFEVNVEMVIQVVNEIDYLDFNDYGPVFQSASSIDDPMFVFSGPLDFELLLNYTHQNYFSMYLEKGYYVFDSMMSEESTLQIEVYDPSGNPVEGGPVYAIEEEGIYRINFFLEYEVGGTFPVTSYQLNPLDVGTPEQPILTTSSTFTIDYNGHQDILLFESAPASGVVLIKGNDYNCPYFGAKAPMTESLYDGSTMNYAFVPVKEGDLVILHFEGDGSQTSSTFEWQFITQEEDSTDVSTMPELNKDETTMIYINKDDTEIHYQLEIDEEGDYLFSYALNLSRTIYGTCRVSIYTESGELIALSLQLSSIHLEKGTYIIHIDQIHGINQLDEYANISTQFFLLFAYHLTKIS